MCFYPFIHRKDLLIWTNSAVSLVWVDWRLEQSRTPREIPQSNVDSEAVIGMPETCISPLLKRSELGGFWNEGIHTTSPIKAARVGSKFAVDGRRVPEKTPMVAPSCTNEYFPQ